MDLSLQLLVGGMDYAPLLAAHPTPADGPALAPWLLREGRCRPSQAGASVLFTAYENYYFFVQHEGVIFTLSLAEFFSAEFNCNAFVCSP